MEITELLEKLIQNTALSKTAFAKELGISKSFMLRVIKGEKKLSENMFSKIISSPLVNEKDKKLLSDIYFKNYFGETNLELLLFFIEKLTSFSKNLDTEEELNINTESISNIIQNDQDTYIIKNSNDFYAWLSYYCTELLKQENPFFYSNFSFMQEQLNAMLYNIFSTRCPDITLDFRHVVRHSSTLTKENISSFFEVIKWSNILLNTEYVNDKEPQQNSFFPYVIITNTAVLTFDFSCSHGLILSQTHIIEYYKNHFQKIFCDSFSAGFFLDDILQMLDLDPNPIFKYIYELNGVACIGPLLDEETFRHMIWDNIDNKDFLVQHALNYYAAHFSCLGFNLYHSEQSLTYFSKSGTIPVLQGNKYIKPCPPKLRAQILTRLKKYINSENNYSFQLLDDNKFQIPQNLDINFSEINVKTQFFFSEKSRKYFKHDTYCFLLQLDSSYYTLFQNLKEYIDKNNFLHDKNYINYFIDNLILENTFPKK